jgi:methylenetetrahydrofolate reductase (NADPH)
VQQGDFSYASELVDLLRQRSGVSIGVAAHPEVHPRSPSREADRDRLADKLLHADFAITQFFFDASHYFGLVQDLAQRGITKPVIPGIMPITNSSQIIRMAELSGAAVPGKIVDGLAACGDDSAGVVDFGVETAAQLARELLDGGAPGIHLYTLNKSTSAHRVAVAVGLA